MQLRKLYLAFLLLPMAGCVSVGSTDLLITPIGVVGVHSFAPQPLPAVDDAKDRREAALR